MTDQILTLKEVAAYLKLAEKTAYKLAAEGKLPGFKVGGSWLLCGHCRLLGNASARQTNYLVLAAVA